MSQIYRQLNHIALGEAYAQKLSCGLTKACIIIYLPGVQPVLSARDMSQNDVEHLGVMSWATQFRNVDPRPPVHDMLRVALDSTSGRVGEPVSV